jgi:hypothetical protein
MCSFAARYLDKCNAVAPCALTYLGIRYSVLRLRDSARLVTRSSPVAVVTALLAPRASSDCSPAARGKHPLLHQGTPLSCPLPPLGLHQARL